MINELKQQYNEKPLNNLEQIKVNEEITDYVSTLNSNDSVINNLYEKFSENSGELTINIDELTNQYNETSGEVNINSDELTSQYKTNKISNIKEKTKIIRQHFLEKEIVFPNRILFYFIVLLINSLLLGFSNSDLWIKIVLLINVILSITGLIKQMNAKLLVKKRLNYIKQYPVFIDFLYYYRDFLPNLNKNHYEINEKTLGKIKELVNFAQEVQENGLELKDCEVRFQNKLQNVLAGLDCFNPNFIIYNKEFYLNPQIAYDFQKKMIKINNILAKNAHKQLPLFVYDWINLQNIQEYEKLLVSVVKEDMYV